MSETTKPGPSNAGGTDDTAGTEDKRDAAAGMPSPDAVEAAARADHKKSVLSAFVGDVKSEILEVEQKILNDEEPRNVSGYTPSAPPSIGVGALNILETAAARLRLMHPFKLYTKWVDEGRLMRGSEQAPDAWAALEKQGIKTVVNLRYEDNTEAAPQAALGMKNVWLPSYDQSLPTRDEIAAFLQVAGDPANLAVYVHCEQGVGRTGVMCAAYRMRRDGWTADQALIEARTMGMRSSDQETCIRQLYADLQSGSFQTP